MQKTVKVNVSSTRVHKKCNKSPNSSPYSIGSKRKGATGAAVDNKLVGRSISCFLQRQEQAQAHNKSVQKLATAATEKTMVSSVDAPSVATQSVPKTFHINWTIFLQQPPDYSESRYPVPLSVFQRLTNCQTVVQRILEDFKMQTSVDFLGDEEIAKRVLINYYVQFYELPDIRKLYPITVKPCPICIKEMILRVPQFNELAKENASINEKSITTPKQLDFAAPVRKCDATLPEPTEKVLRYVSTAQRRKTKLLHKSQICDELILQYIARRVKNPENIQIVLERVKHELILRKKAKRQQQKLISERRPSKPQILSVKTIVPANAMTAHTLSAEVLNPHMEVAIPNMERAQIHAVASTPHTETSDPHMAALMPQTSPKQVDSVKSVTENNLQEAKSIYFRNVSNYCTLPYLLRFYRRSKRQILAAIMTMSCKEFKRYTQIHGAPTAYDDEKLLKRCYKFTLQDPQVWPNNLFIGVVELYRFLKTRHIVFDVLNLVDISPKFLHWQDLVTCTNYDDCVRLDYYRKTGENMPEALLEKRRRAYYNKCWLHDKWLRIVPTINANTLIKIKKALWEITLENVMPMAEHMNTAQAKNAIEQQTEETTSEGSNIAASGNKNQSNGKSIEKLSEVYCEATENNSAKVVSPLKRFNKQIDQNAKALEKHMDVHICSKVLELPAPIVETKHEPIQLENETQQKQEELQAIKQQQARIAYQQQKNLIIQRQLQRHELNNDHQPPKSQEHAQLHTVQQLENNTRAQQQQQQQNYCNLNHVSVLPIQKASKAVAFQEIQHQQPTITDVSASTLAEKSRKAQQLPTITKDIELPTASKADVVELQQQRHKSPPPEFISTITKISMLPTATKSKSPQISQVQSVMARIAERLSSQGLSTDAISVLNKYIKKEKEFVPLRNLQFDVTGESGAVCEQVDFDTVIIEDSQNSQESIIQLLSPTETSSPTSFPLQIAESNAEENFVIPTPIEETQPLELAKSLRQDKNSICNKRNKATVAKAQASQRAKRAHHKAVNTNFVPQLTHEFRPLPMITSKRTNIPAPIDATVLNLHVTPSPPAAALNDESSDIATSISQKSQNTSTVSQSVTQALSGDTTLFNNTRILKIVNQQHHQPSQQHEMDKQQQQQSQPTTATNTKLQPAITERLMLDAIVNVLSQRKPRH